MNAAKPVVVITGAAGDIGTSLTRAIESEYTVVGMDLKKGQDERELIEIDFTSDDSVRQGFEALNRRHGDRIAAFVHLAAYFDFTGEEHPLYEQVNVAGTARLLRALQAFQVERFIYSSTMLVHRAGKPGDRIDESTPIEPRWAYPSSKARTEDVIRREHGAIPYVILRLAGLYDERTCVPTLANQIARIYERDFESRLHPGPTDAGQSFIHRDDMMDAFRRAIDRRAHLPAEAEILVGEPDAMSFEQLQDALGRLIHGAEAWATLSIPPPVAKAGAWMQQKAEPLVPDTLDAGKPPFIRPFMVDLAQDHYALDIGRAQQWLGWAPRHDIHRTLPQLIAELQRDPVRWYRANRIVLPEWIESAGAAGENPNTLREQHERRYREEHRRSVWAPFANLALASWLITAPSILNYQSAALACSDIASGIALAIFGLLSLSWRLGWARWSCAVIGCWLLFAPLVFWAPTAAEYLNDTLAGMLIIGFAVCTLPTPGISPPAACLGPTVPPGWEYSPSAWTQRLPVIALAFVGLHVSRYLAAYQLGHIDTVWEPFFAGGADPKNGTEEIITSSVSEAWPVSDAGLGAMTYALEILTGMMGSARRWRTMPWLVMLFGLMIVPLGAVSLIFIIIQPIVIGTWCSLCLIAAAAMLLQIPYSLDELVATGQFLWRRKQAGHSMLRVFLVGDTDDGEREKEQEREFERTSGAILRDVVGGGVSVPWNLAAAASIGVWLMLTRLTLGADGAMANADHLIGSLVITVCVIACAEVARAARWANTGLGVALLVTPFAYDASTVQLAASLICGALLILLSVRRGAVRQRYGNWQRFVR